MRRDGQDSPGDAESIPFAVTIDLRFAVAMPILADPRIVHGLPLFSVQPGSVKFILPDEGIRIVRLMGSPESWRLPANFVCFLGTLGRSKRQ